jgi:DNA-binding NtrC family response regulator
MPAESQMNRTSKSAPVSGQEESLGQTGQPGQVSSCRKKAQVLVLAIDAQTRDCVASILGGEACDLQRGDLQYPLGLLQASGINVVLLCLENSGSAGFDLIKRIKGACQAVEVILISPHANDRLWIESIQRGAYDLLPIPLVKSELVRVVNNAIARSRG